MPLISNVQADAPSRDPQTVDHRFIAHCKRHGVHLEAEHLAEHSSPLLATPCPQQFSQLPSRLDEAQRRTPLVEIREKNVEIERLRIPEWDADFVVLLGAADLIRCGHLGEVREQLHERVESVLVA
jgi:hypothetical protein